MWRALALVAQLVLEVALRRKGKGEVVREPLLDPVAEPVEVARESGSVVAEALDLAQAVEDSGVIPVAKDAAHALKRIAKKL